MRNIGVAGERKATMVRNLSPRWVRLVWISALSLAVLAGAYVGADLTTTVAGAILGAAMAAPVGVVGALIVVSIGSLLIGTNDNSGSSEADGQGFRLIFSASVSAIIGLLLLISVILLGGTPPPSAYIQVAGVAAIVAVMGYFFPPTESQ